MRETVLRRELPHMDFPERMTADQIVDEIKRQFRPLAERGYKPEVVEISEQYAAQLDSRFLRAPHLTMSLDERMDPRSAVFRSDACSRLAFCASSWPERRAVGGHHIGVNRVLPTN